MLAQRCLLDQSPSCRCLEDGLLDRLLAQKLRHAGGDKHVDYGNGLLRAIRRRCIDVTDTACCDDAYLMT